MQTIKTLVVVVLLIAVCYGAFVALNAPDVNIPDELEQWANSTTEQEIDAFEIPSLSIPEPFSTTPVPSGSFAGSPQSQPVGPQFPGSDLSQIPTFEQPTFQSIDPPSAQFAQAGPSTTATPPLPPLPSPGTGSLNNPTPPASGALLTSTANDAGPISGGMAEGHAIPFNASALPSNDLPTFPDIASDNSAIDELISAGVATAGETTSNFSTTDTTNAPSAFNAPPESAEQPSTPAIPASTTAPTNGLSNPSNSNPPSTKPLQPFAEARSEALSIAQAGKLADALELLSSYYDSPELSYAEHTDLVDMLDALSREVIYSDRPFLGSAYQVSAIDTLQGLAEKHRVNAELIAAINKMGESQALLPNSQIKLLDGPFRAQLSLSRGELTVFLGKLYAGRFPVSVSKVNQPPLGTFEIVDRRRDRTFYGATTPIPAGAPNNPYGGYWLSLGSNIAIHGSPEQVTSDLEGAGSISLSPLDAADIYRILSKGSAVEIRQ